METLKEQHNHVTSINHRIRFPRVRFSSPEKMSASVKVELFKKNKREEKNVIPNSIWGRRYDA